jgi:hypothetical protein
MFRQNHFHPIVIRERSNDSFFVGVKPSLINEFIREKRSDSYAVGAVTAASEIPVVSVLFKEA